MHKCLKQCHSEELKRFFAALRMTGFYIVRILRAIRDELFDAISVSEHGSSLLPDAISSVLFEHFLLMCKRKCSQKKSTRVVPARHPTAAAQTHARRLFSTCSAHAPANSLSLRQCGLVRTALPPVPSPLSGKYLRLRCGLWRLALPIQRVQCDQMDKKCHSEERSDEESLMISLGFKRFFAALRMTGFCVVRFDGRFVMSSYGI